MSWRDFHDVLPQNGYVIKRRTASNPPPAVDLAWEGNHKFVASDAYGHQLTVESPMNDGDDFDGFKPTRLMLLSLGACTGIVIVNILRKQRHNATGVEIMVKSS